jgi:hypothetical protein
VLFRTIVGNFGRQLCQVQLEFFFVSTCVLLELEDNFVQVKLELLFLYSCFFLELEDKFFQVQLELLFVSSCAYMELEDKFFQVELEFLFVSSYVFLELEKKIVQVKLIQVDIGGHPPFPTSSKKFSSNFGNLLFLVVFQVLKLLEPF